MNTKNQPKPPIKKKQAQIVEIDQDDIDEDDDYSLDINFMQKAPDFLFTEKQKLIIQHYLPPRYGFVKIDPITQNIISPFDQQIKLVFDQEQKKQKLPSTSKLVNQKRVRKNKSQFQGISQKVNKKKQQKSQKNSIVEPDTPTKQKKMIQKFSYYVKQTNQIKRLFQKSHTLQQKIQIKNQKKQKQQLKYKLLQQNRKIAHDFIASKNAKDKRKHKIHSLSSLSTWEFKGLVGNRKMQDLKRQFLKMIQTIKTHEYIDPFLQPVDQKRDGAPDYYKIIQKPMDLSTIQRNIKEDKYIQIQQLKMDFFRMWMNARQYNINNSCMLKATNVLQKVLSNLFVDILLQNKIEQKHFQVVQEQQQIE